MLKKNNEILRVKYVVTNNFLDVEDLTKLLEITPEDLLDRFEDRLYEHKDKFLLEESYDVMDETELGAAEAARKETGETEEQEEQEISY